MFVALKYVNLITLEKSKTLCHSTLLTILMEVTVIKMCRLVLINEKDKTTICFNTFLQYGGLYEITIDLDHVLLIWFLNECFIMN